MTKIRVKTQAQLRNFLEILAEEAVSLAKADVDARSQQSKIAADIKQSKARFMQEEEQPTAPETSAAEPQEAPAQGETPTPPAPKPTGKEMIQPKLGELIDAINKLRGVPSARDSDVEEKLRTYFDTLTPAEASSLLVMVRSVGGVMDSKEDPVSAKDPRDYDIMTKFKDELKKAEKAAASEPAEQEPAAQSPEKIEPPIKAGQPQQVSEAYRQKIKALLGSR